MLAVEEYELKRPTKSYPKRRLLPQLEDEALKPTLPAYDVADRPPRGREKAAYQPEVQPAPHRQPNKHTKAWGNTQDLRDVLENKAGHKRSIYGSRGRAQRVTTTVTPDILKANPDGLNTVDKNRMNCVVI